MPADNVPISYPMVKHNFNGSSSLTIYKNSQSFT